MKIRLLLFFVLLAKLLPAQEPMLYFETLTVNDGLSHNKVNCILQDRQGFVWIGTDDGLNRYDGKRFTQFHRRSDSASLSGNIVTDLFEDRGGRIWIATSDGGLCRYDHRLPPPEQFKQYKPKQASLSTGSAVAINAMLQDTSGLIWLGTSGHSVWRFDPRTECFEDIAKNTKTILDLCLGNDGQIWAGRQGGGLLKIHPATLKMTEDERYKHLYAKLPHASITAFFKDSRNAVWFGSWDKVLYRAGTGTEKEAIYQQRGPASYQNDEALSFAEDWQGWLWIGGKEKGLHIYNPQTGRFSNLRYDPSKEGGLADNRINCVFRDESGRMWLGTNRGICINNPGKQQFVQQFLPSAAGSALTVFDFFEDEDGTIWMGTSNGIYLKTKNGIVKHRTLAYKGRHLHASKFFQDEDGRFYVGTDYSLFEYNRTDQRLALLPNTEKDSVMNNIIDSRIVSAVKGNVAGRPVLLVSPYGHFLAYYDFEKKRWVSRFDSSNIIRRFNLKDNLVRKLYKAKNGTVWMATAKEGLARWTSGSLSRAEFFNHQPQNEASLSGNNVYDMTEDEKGNLWVSTYGGGLNYFDVQRKTSRHIEGANNLVEGIETDIHGNVWMVGNGHLHRYDPRRKTHTSYYLPDREKTGGVSGRIFKDRSGNMYVAGVGYFISFNPDSLHEASFRPRVYLTDFQIFNKSFSHLLYNESIELKHNDNYFSIEFAAPDFFSGSPVQYSYKLDGLDTDWVDAGERNYASYPNLAGGRYVFKVRASNTPGVWPSEYASVVITVVPPYWKRPWFFFACVVAVALATYALYRYRINELLKRQAIRNRIAQDLHDNVGSTLSSISVYSQVAKIYHRQQKEGELQTTLERISATSSEMIAELNDTVWAINPRNDNMQVMLQRMESFAKPLLAAQDIRFHLNHDPSLTHLNLDMEKRKNFYLVFKETVHNAIKYAGCKNLWVTVKQSGRFVNMKIEDDGKGFDLAKTSEGYKSSDVFGGGNGLKNMQLRAGEMKGNLTIRSKAGKGTTVMLRFPVT